MNKMSQVNQMNEMNLTHAPSKPLTLKTLPFIAHSKHLFMFNLNVTCFAY